MPLEKSSSKSAFKHNVKTLMNEIGKSPHVQSREQALAIAYETKRRGRAMGGLAPAMTQAFNPMGVAANPGASANVPLAPPSTVASLGVNTAMGGARPFKKGGVSGIPSVPKMGTKMTTGPLVSAVPGRTDKHLTHVPSGSYVVPADIVSGHGQGNTLAGMNALHNLFRMDTAGKSSVKNFPSRPVGASKFKKGGNAEEHVGKPTKVILAGGELVIPPGNVHETMERLHGKKLTLDQAHKLCDKWVIAERKRLIKTLKKLPGPAQD